MADQAELWANVIEKTRAQAQAYAAENDCTVRDALVSFRLNVADKPMAVEMIDRCLAVEALDRSVSSDSGMGL